MVNSRLFTIQFQDGEREVGDSSAQSVAMIK